MNTLELPLDIGELIDVEEKDPIDELLGINPAREWNVIGFIAKKLLIGRDLDYYDHRPLGPWAWLDDFGITHVIDLREEDEIGDEPERLTYRTRPVDYTNIGTHDNGGPQEDAWFEAGLATVARALDQPNARIFMHCHMGVARAPSMCFAIMLAAGMDPMEALTHIRAQRPVAAISYAGYALDWWLRRQNASEDVREEAYACIESWFEENPIDLAWIIDEIHADGG